MQSPFNCENGEVNGMCKKLGLTGQDIMEFINEQQKQEHEREREERAQQ